MKALLATMETVDPAHYDRRHLHDDVGRDVEVLTSIYDRIRHVKPVG